MIRGTQVLLLTGLLVVSLAAAGFATDLFNPYVVGDKASWMFNNITGVDVTGLHVEFDQEVTILAKVEFGGYLMAVGASSGTVFDFAGGELIAGGTVILDWQPADAVPTFILWMDGEQAVGTPYFTTIDKLGYLLGQGIVHVRETNPAALSAAFDQFFLDNAEYLAGLSESLGMSFADSLMPIIMTAPPEGIENFFNTVVGMLGVTSLEDVLGGDLDWSALLTLLGL
jgi:hypothetical protein